MPFRSVFIAVFLGTALIVAALLVHERRPTVERNQPTAALAEATGKCAECHRRETSAIVRRVRAEPARAEGRQLPRLPPPGRGAGRRSTTAASSSPRRSRPRTAPQCHASRVRPVRAQPARGAVLGRGQRREGLLPRAARPRGEATTRAGSTAPPIAIGADRGRGGDGRRVQRLPRRGQAQRRRLLRHLHQLPRPPPRLRRARARAVAPAASATWGPTTRRSRSTTSRSTAPSSPPSARSMNLRRRPEAPHHRRHARAHLRDLPHERPRGDEGHARHHRAARRGSSSRPSRRRRPAAERAPDRDEGGLPQVPRRARGSTPSTPRAEQVLAATNEKVQGAKAVVAALRTDGLLTPQPFDEPIEFTEFDLWHYYGRTAKHGAFMGGADFVQWHGNYELLRHARRASTPRRRSSARPRTSRTGGAAPARLRHGGAAGRVTRAPPASRLPSAALEWSSSSPTSASSASTSSSPTPPTPSRAPAEWVPGRLLRRWRRCCSCPGCGARSGPRTAGRAVDLAVRRGRGRRRRPRDGAST